LEGWKAGWFHQGWFYFLSFGVKKNWLHFRQKGKRALKDFGGQGKAIGGRTNNNN